MVLTPAGIAGALLHHTCEGRQKCERQRGRGWRFEMQRDHERPVTASGVKDL